MKYQTLRTGIHKIITASYRLLLNNKSQNGMRVLMYHAVGTPITDDAYGLYNLSPDQFASQMRILASSFRQFLTPLNAEYSSCPSFKIAVTFDDGYRDNLSVAMPIMAELEIPFTVFVCTDAVKLHAPGFLRPDDLRALAKCPYAQIGSHGSSHRHLTTCTDNELKNELEGSKSYLEDLLGLEIDMLSYPHGAVDQRVINFAREAGYKLAACSTFSINTPDQAPFLLARTDIWKNDSSKVFKQKLAGDWDWLRWR